MLGVGHGCAGRRYTRKRAWLYFLKGLGGLAPPRRDSMLSEEDSQASYSDEDDFTEDEGESCGPARIRAVHVCGTILWCLTCVGSHSASPPAVTRRGLTRLRR